MVTDSDGALTPTWALDGAVVVGTVASSPPLSVDCNEPASPNRASASRTHDGNGIKPSYGRVSSSESLPLPLPLPAGNNARARRASAMPEASTVPLSWSLSLSLASPSLPSLPTALRKRPRATSASAPAPAPAVPLPLPLPSPGPKKPKSRARDSMCRRSRCCMSLSPPLPSPLASTLASMLSPPSRLPSRHDAENGDSSVESALVGLEAPPGDAAAVGDFPPAPAWTPLPLLRPPALPRVWGSPALPGVVIRLGVVELTELCGAVAAPLGRPAGPATATGATGEPLALALLARSGDTHQKSRALASCSA